MLINDTMGPWFGIESHSSSTSQRKDASNLLDDPAHLLNLRTVRLILSIMRGIDSRTLCRCNEALQARRTFN